MSTSHEGTALTGVAGTPCTPAAAPRTPASTPGTPRTPASMPTAPASTPSMLAAAPAAPTAGPSLSRRGFVAGAGAAVAGVAACTAAGAFRSAAVAGATEASTEGNTDAGAAAAPQTAGTAATAPIEPVVPPATWDYEADVVIVGAGGGGLNAAVHARELGLSALVVEKMPMVGGNTQNATMFTGVNDTPAQNEAEFAIPSYPFDVDAWVSYIESGTGHSSDPEMLKVIGENMPVVFQWMTDTYGIDWTLAGGGTFYYAQAIGMDSIVKAAYECGQQAGVEYLLETEVQCLVVEGDRVIGVKALSSDGTEIYLHATAGVLLTGGGFAANRDLLAEYCPSALERAAACYLTDIDSGECFRMGLGAGADVTARNSFTMFDGGLDWYQAGGTWCRYLYDGATQVMRQPWLALKKDGSRIRYIDSSVLGALTDLAAVETAEFDHRTRIVFDANWDSYLAGVDTYAESFAQHACREPVQEGMYRHDFIPEYYRDYHTGFQDAVDAGLIVQADTLEELAELIDMDPQVLTASVERWNEVCAAGEDDFVYPKPAAWLHPVDTPPFYGAKIGGFLFMTSTGLKINTKMQVLSAAGTPIEGLYAGWYTAGGPGGPDLLTSMSYDYGGVSRSYLGGYLAAESIAAAAQ